MGTYQATPRREATPELIAEITRRAHLERSQAVWRMLQSVFGSHRDEEVPEATAKLQPRSS